MGNLAEDKKGLANNIGDFAAAHGAEELAKLLSRSLLGIVYHIGAEEAEFKDDIGRVQVVCTPIAEMAKS